MLVLSADYVIAVLVIAVVLFTSFVYYAWKYRKGIRQDRQTKQELLTTTTELLTTLSGGLSVEDNLKVFEINGKEYSVKDNDLTLEELVKQNDNEEDYLSYLEIVASLIKERYENYRFLRISPTHGDYESGYFLSFTINREQVPVEYEYLFRLAVSKGLTDSKINDLFYKQVQEGKIIPLGDVEIVAGTAISPVTQAEDLMANIVFMPRDYYNKHMEGKEE